MINSIITGQAARRSQSMSVATIFTCCIKGKNFCVVADTIAGRRSFDALKHYNRDAIFTRCFISSSASSKPDNGAKTSTSSSVPSNDSDIVATGESSVSSSSNNNNNKSSSQGDNIATTTTASPPNDSLHSADIAFKPTESGWGYNPRYSKSFDNIFATKEKKELVVSPKSTEGGKSTTTPIWPFDDKDIIEQRRQLESIIENALALTKEEQRHLVDTISTNLNSEK